MTLKPSNQMTGGLQRSSWRPAWLPVPSISSFVARYATDIVLLSPAILLLVVFYFTPILQILLVSFTEPRPGISNYVELFSSPPLQRIFGTTFRMSAITTFIALLLGYIIAYGLVTISSRAARIMLILILLPFWISILVRAFSWMVILRSNGFLNSSLLSLGIVQEPLDLMFNERGVVIGMVHYMVPLAALTIYSQMRGIDYRYVRAARGLGASPLTAFLQTFAPLSLPGVIAAAILLFISALGFFITPAILGGGKSLMIAEYISFLITQTLNWGLGTALAVVLTIGVFVLLGLLSLFVNLRQLYGAK